MTEKEKPTPFVLVIAGAIVLAGVVMIGWGLLWVAWQVGERLWG